MRFSDELIGVEWKVVRRCVDQDACHGEDQAQPGPSPAQRPRQCEGRLAVYARGKGNFNISLPVCGKKLKLKSMTT